VRPYALYQYALYPNGVHVSLVHPGARAGGAARLVPLAGAQGPRRRVASAVQPRR